MPGIRPDRGAHVEHDGLPPDGWPQASDCRPLDAGHGLETDFGHGHQRAGVARGDRHVCFALLDRIDGEPHGGLPSPLTQSLTRLGIHLDRNVGVNQARDRLEPRPARDQRLDDGTVAKQNEFDIGMPGERHFRPGHDHRCAMVAPHGVKRDADLIRHGGTLETVTAAGAGNAVLREQ